MGYIKKGYEIIYLNPNANHKLNAYVKFAYNFTNNNKYTGKNIKECVCCKASLKNFFYKYQVPYFICENCFSVYTFPEKSLLEKFNKDKQSISYNKKAFFTERKYILKSYLDWIKHSQIRYSKTNSCNILGVDNKYIIQYIQEQLGDITFNTHINAYQDIVLDNILQSLRDPYIFLQDIYNKIDTNLLFINTRISNGFDILALKGNCDKIYPYEHIFLPSEVGLITLLQDIGFSILEICTPGLLDVHDVDRQFKDIDNNNLFIRYLYKYRNTEYMKEDLQKFLQKYHMSSSVRLIVRKK